DGEPASGHGRLAGTPRRPGSPPTHTGPRAGPPICPGVLAMPSRAAVRCLAITVAILVAPWTARAADTPPTEAPPHAEPPRGEPRPDPPRGEPGALLVQPARVSLDGPRDEQHLGVLGESPDGRRWDLSRAARYTSSAPGVVSVSPQGLLRGGSDGQAIVTV